MQLAYQLHVAFLRSRFYKVITSCRRWTKESVEFFNIQAGIYKPKFKKFDSKINNDIKSFQGVET